MIFLLDISPSASFLYLFITGKCNLYVIQTDEAIQMSDLHMQYYGSIYVTAQKRLQSTTQAKAL